MAVANLTTTAEEIADREITLWKMRTVPLPATDDPLMEWKRSEEISLCPFFARLARRVLPAPATSASPERLFSTAGNEMTKKRMRLTRDNMETVIYLQRCGPKLASGRLANTSRRFSCCCLVVDH